MSLCFLTSTRIHVMALDGLVNVNSLFTVALFLGLAAMSDPRIPDLIGGNSSCAASTTIAKNLVTFHVYSFSSFLFSSLVALALKQAIRIAKSCDDSGGEDGDEGIDMMRKVSLGHINMAALRAGTLASGLGSVFGCGFLMMALVNLVQIKLGTLACGSKYTFAAIVPLVVLVPFALTIYVGLVLYAFKK